MTLTIIGLGPGHPDDVTRRAWQHLQAAPELYLRTAKHPVVEALDRAYESFDALYESAVDFESLYQTITAQVIDLARRPQGVVYAVPGHPLVGEHTVTLILEKARAEQIPVEIIDGLSFIEPTLALLGLDGMDGLQIHDCAEIAYMYHPPLNPDQPALLAQLYSRDVASQVKLTLMNQYPDEHPVVLIHGAGLPDAMREDLPLYEIDRSPHVAHLSTLYVPPVAVHSSFARFQETIAHLRSPEGCPWDRKQTHLSLRAYLLEETYEVLEALDNEDMDALAEELGDLLLQVVLHSQVAIDEGNFTMNDILAGINSKIIRRHPHVWGDVEVETEADLHKVWQAQKAAEKADNGNTPKSLLADIPVALPALSMADKLQAKAAKVGFDWATVEPVIEKVLEEIEEVKTAPADKLQHEIGDLLFAVVNWARWLKVDPETALRESNQRFKRRFAYVEQHAPQPLTEMSLDEMDTLWEAAKAQGL